MSRSNVRYNKTHNIICPDCGLSQSVTVDFGITVHRNPKRKTHIRICEHDGCENQLRYNKTIGLCQDHEPWWCNQCLKLITPSERLRRYRGYGAQKKVIKKKKYRRTHHCCACDPQKENDAS